VTWAVVGRWENDFECAACPVASAPGFPFHTFVDEVGGAPAYERALEASEAWRAKCSGQAVSGGQEGRRERPASGQGHSRPAGFTARAGFTESSGLQLLVGRNCSEALGSVPQFVSGALGADRSSHALPCRAVKLYLQSRRVHPLSSFPMPVKSSSFSPFRRWAPAYWRTLVAKFYWRPLVSGPPLGFRTADFEDSRLTGKPWVYRVSYDPRAFGQRICLTFAPCDPATIDLKRLQIIVAALWQMRCWQPDLIYHDVHVDLSDCVDGDLPHYVFRVAKRPGEQHPLLPNLHLLSRRRGIPKAKPWEKKADTCWFRGAATGDTKFEKNKRVAICQVAKQVARVDSRLTSAPGVSAEFVESCQRAGIMGPPTCFTEMNNHRYLLDVDGNTTSWDRYLRIGLFGGVPIRFEPFWTEYWHQQLIEGQNVVTVDRTTFADQLASLREDERRSQMIAERASELARTALSREAVLRVFADRWAACRS
jgi:hypothetical protein